MIPEISQFALVLGLCMAILHGLAPLLGGHGATSSTPDTPFGSERWKGFRGRTIARTVDTWRFFRMESRLHS